MPTIRLVPYLCCNGAAKAIEFYKQVFGAVETMRYEDGDGRVGHAELRIGDAEIYLADEYPEIGVVSPLTLKGTPVALHLSIDAVDDVHARALAAGAAELRPPQEQSHGARDSTILDPFGHRWMLSTPVAEVSVAEIAEREKDWKVTGSDPSSSARG